MKTHCLSRKLLFHTGGYENEPLRTCFIPWAPFSYLGHLFHTLDIFFIPWASFSYLSIIGIFSYRRHHSHTFEYIFIPSMSVFSYLWDANSYQNYSISYLLLVFFIPWELPASVHACPTPHSGKTQRRPALHVSTGKPPSHAHPVVIGTRLSWTDDAYPRCHAPTPWTHAVAPTPAAHPRRTSVPRMQARPEYARRNAVQAQETRFSAYGSRMRATPATRSRPVHMAWDREA